MNNPPYIIEDVFTGIVAAVATALGRPVYSHYSEIRELNQTLQQYNQDPASFNKKYPLILMQQPVTIGPSRLTQIYGEIPVLVMFIITGSEANLKRKERDAKNYVPIVNPILYELKRQVTLCQAFLGYESQLKWYATKYPYWGAAQKNVLSDIVDVMQVKILNVKVENNLNC